MMVIKQYSNENLGDLTFLMNQWFDEKQYSPYEIADSIEFIQNKSENKIFIAENSEGKVKGYVLTGICYYIGFKPFVEIIQLLVDKDSRDQGIGTSLIEFVEEYYKEQRIEEIKLHSRIERGQAHNFYRKLGFKEFKQSKFFEKEIENK
jgi:ribosomal protein S18 acetylase RimI-like enzyme